MENLKMRENKTYIFSACYLADGAAGAPSLFWVTTGMQIKICNYVV